MPPAYVSQPGVPTYYLPPPGRPYNPLADWIHTFTATTSPYAARTYDAWLAMQALPDPALALEQEITKRMQEREKSMRAAAQIAAQRYGEQMSTYRTNLQALGSMAVQDSKARTEMASQREQTYREINVEGASLDTDPHAVELRSTAQGVISGYAQDLRDIMRTSGSEEEATQRVFALQNEMDTRLGSIAREVQKLDPLQQEAMQTELSNFAAQVMSGENQGDPRAIALLREPVVQAFGTPGTPTVQRPGVGAIDHEGVFAQARAQTRLSDPEFGGGGRDGGSFRIGGGGSPGAGITPDDLNLDDVADRIRTDRANTERDLEELLVRMLAPGVMNRRDRQVQRALDEAGLDMTPNQLLSLGRSLDAAGAAPASEPDPAAVGDRNAATDTRVTAARPVGPEGAILPGGTHVAPPPATDPPGSGRKGEGGATVGPPLPDGLPEEYIQGLRRMTYDEAVRLDSSGHLPQMRELVSIEPETLTPEQREALRGAIAARRIVDDVLLNRAEEYGPPQVGDEQGPDLSGELQRELADERTLDLAEAAAPPGLTRDPRLQGRVENMTPRLPSDTFATPRPARPPAEQGPLLGQAPPAPVAEDQGPMLGRPPLGRPPQIPAPRMFEYGYGPVDDEPYIQAWRREDWDRTQASQRRAAASQALLDALRYHQVDPADAGASLSEMMAEQLREIQRQEDERRRANSVVPDFAPEFKAR